MGNSDPERLGFQRMIKSYFQFGARSKHDSVLSKALSSSRYDGIPDPSQIGRTVVLHSLAIASIPLASQTTSPPSNPIASLSSSVSLASQATYPPSKTTPLSPTLVSPAFQATCSPSQTTASLPNPMCSKCHDTVPISATISSVSQRTASSSPAISSTSSTTYPPPPRTPLFSRTTAQLSRTASRTSCNPSDLSSTVSQLSESIAPPSVVPSPSPQDTVLSFPAIAQSSQSAPSEELYFNAASTSIPSLIPANTPEELWEKAFKKLSPQDRHSIHCSTSSSKIDILSQIIQMTHQRREQYEENQWKIRYGEKTVVIRDVADKVIRWMDKFKSIGNIAVSVDPVHAALPWAAFRFLLIVAGEDSARVGSVFLVLEGLIVILIRCEIYEGLYLKGVRFSPVFELLEAAMVVLYAAILAFLSKAKRFYEAGTAERIVADIFDVDCFQPSITSINKAEAEVNKMVNVAEATVKSSQHQQVTEETRRLHDLLVEIEEPIVRIHHQVTAILKKFDEARRTQILTWISRIPYIKHHERAKEGRVNITGEWLLERDFYQEWYHAKESTILWLHGIPGAGKTKLTSRVIDVHLEELQSRIHSEGFAYFYCNHKEQDRREPASIFRALLKQLSIHPRSSALYVPIIEEYDLRRRDGFASGDLLLDQCKALIIQLLNLIPKTTIIIDGLDECDLKSLNDVCTRDDLLDALQELVHVPVKGVVKVFVSSREDHDIMKAFGRVPNLRIRLTDNAKEIGLFVDLEVRKKIATGKLLDGKVKETLEEQICTALKTNANGMFLWVDLQIKMLCGMSIESDVIARLGSLPASLEEAYRDIFIHEIDREEGSGKRLAYLAMMWMLCSAEGPLCPEELVMGSVSALRVESPGQPETIGSDVTIETILKICHNLVVIDHQLGLVRFAHLSVQEYLEKRLSTEETNTMAAIVCLSILLDRIPQTLSNTLEISEPSSPHTGTQHEDESESGEDWSSVYPRSIPGTYDGSFKYASRQWHTHVKLCGDSITPSRVMELLKCFLGSFEKPSDAFINWLNSDESAEWWCYPEPLEHHKSLISCPSSVMPTVCYYGLTDILMDMWTSGQSFDVNMVNSFGHPLLSIACGRGNEWIVRELLNRGAQIDQLCTKYQSALKIAVYYGHPAILRILLEYVADRSPDGPTIFHILGYTAERRELGCLKALVSVVKGKEIEIRKLDALASNTLAAAVRGGSIDIIRVICQEFAGADLDLPSRSWGKTALHIALELGFSEVANFLVLKGAKFQNVGRVALEDLDWACDEHWYTELTRWMSNIPAISSYTPVDVLIVRKMLRTALGLPVKSVDRILDLSEYWVMTEVEREEYKFIEEHDELIPYISLQIKSHLRFPVRKIIFTIRSHDQGWTTRDDSSNGQGSYHASLTWFEAAVHQNRSHTLQSIVESYNATVPPRQKPTHTSSHGIIEIINL
ncbi:hypothetical protein P167DRAFT_580246 [Morchella conica CCBAS932]|uniref:NACHT domain-containing protein n=1 Tax=Morchella conica CCBAS932 TaxID=1392247 RepID=A0A3N4KE05_9PEZI|nr:hypothetical protein P167DRAFT_580246 [Morchella conica CCBAS932]